MCCFLLVLGALGPRLAFLYEWIFTERVNIAFDNGLFLSSTNRSTRASSGAPSRRGGSVAGGQSSPGSGPAT